MLKEYHFDSWEEFKYLYLERLSISSISNRKTDRDTPFLFRGHGDSSWKLISSFDRAYSKLKYDVLLKSFKQEFEDPVTANHFSEQKKIFDEFREKQAQNINANSELPIEAVSLGQHYGLPTKLLDWSESPYIAAFFAFSDAIPLLSSFSKKEILADKKEIVIWALENSDRWKNRGLIIHRPDRDRNFRISIQKGYFTEFNKKNSYPESSMEELIKRKDMPLAFKFYIPASQSGSAIKDLSLMGIDSTSLYGDLSGRARSALNKAVLKHLDLDSKDKN